MTSSLGALLELMHRARGRIETFEGEYRTWHRPRPSTRVIAARDANGRATVRWLGAGPRVEPTVSVTRFWALGSHSMRVEVWRGRALAVLGVRVGAQWWHWDRRDGVTAGGPRSDAAADELPPLLSPPLLLDPAPLLAMMSLEPAGVGIRAGRDVLIARGKPRAAAGAPLTYEVEVDAMHGALLRRSVADDDGVFHVTEATAVSFGGAISPERFSFDPSAVERLATGTAQPRDAPPVPPSDQPGRRARLARRNGTIPGATIWLTGLSGAGKTTLAHAIQEVLARRGRAAVVLDGDTLRQGLSADLGFAREDCAEQVRRAAQVSALLSQSGLVAIAALVSPYAVDRQEARAIHAASGLRFIEVWVDTPLEICRQRDVERLYARAAAGELHGLAGVDLPYQPPSRPEVRVPGQRDTEVVAEELVDTLLSRAHERPVSG